MASKRIKGITIQIGADTRELNQAIKEFESNISKSKSQLRDVNNLLKMDPKNMVLLTQKQNALTEAIKNTEEKIKEEYRALEQLKAGPQNDKTIEQQERLSREIIANEQDLKSLKNEYKDFGSVAQQQAKVAADGMKEVGQTIQQAGQGITDVGKSMTKYVTAPIAAAGAASIKRAADFEEGMSRVQAISGATTEQMLALEEKGLEMASKTKYTASETADAYAYMAMAGWKSEEMIAGLPGVMNLAIASGEDLADTSDIVTDSLTAFNLTAKDTDEFVNVLAAAATNSNTTVGMMGQAFKYAAAPAGTLGYNINDVALALGLMANNGIKSDMAGTSLRNMFNRMAKPTKESQQAIDRMGLSLYDAQGNMYSFREVMEQMRSGFSSINMSAEEFDRRVDQLDQDLASGALTQAKYDKTLEELTLEAFGAEQAEKARAAAMLGGTRAMSGLLAIVNASDDEFYGLADAIDSSSEKFAMLADGSIMPLNEALESGAEIIGEYNGQAEAMGAVMLNNVNGQMTILKSKLDILAVSFGDLLLPKVSAVVEKVSELVDQFQALDDESKETVISVGAVAAAIGPALLIIGGAVTAFGKFVEALGIIKGAFAAGGVFAGIGKVFSDIGGAFKSVFIGIASGLKGIATGIGEAMSGVGTTIMTACAEIAAAVAMFFMGAEIGKVVSALLFPDDIDLYESYQGIVGTVQMCIDTLDAMWYQFSETFKSWWEYQKGMFERLKNYIKSTFDGIKANVQGALLGIKTAVTVVWTFIQAYFKSKIDFIKGVVTGGFKFILDTIKEKLGSAKDEVNNTIEAIKLAFEAVIELAKTWGKELVDNFIGGIKGKVDVVKDAMSFMTDTIKSYIHFSEPDVGPLSDFNTWMPDMMKQLAEQITAGIPLVESAMQSTAGVMRSGIESVDYSEQLASINTGIGQLATAGGGVVDVTINLDKYKLGHAIANINQTNVYRSGGR